VSHWVQSWEAVASKDKREEKMPDLIQVSPHQQIARRAYEIYLERGGIDGGDLVDWFLAEQELKVGLHQPAAEPGRAKADRQTDAGKVKRRT